MKALRNLLLLLMVLTIATLTSFTSGIKHVNNKLIHPEHLQFRYNKPVDTTYAFGYTVTSSGNPSFPYRFTIYLARVYPNGSYTRVTYPTDILITLPLTSPIYPGTTFSYPANANSYFDDFTTDPTGDIDITTNPTIIYGKSLLQELYQQ